MLEVSTMRASEEVCREAVSEAKNVSVPAGSDISSAK
jgi:hypothetical protein